MRIVSDINVLIADELPIVRCGLVRFLEKQPGMQVCGEYISPAELVRDAHVSRPSVVIIDAFSQKARELHPVKELISNGFENVLTFSSQATWDDVREFMSAGGLGVVSKSASLNELATAICSVAEGKTWISPSFRSVSPARRPASDDIPDMSPREEEIAVLVAQGFTSGEIADRLCLSRRTVENHRYRIFRKLGIHSRSQLVRYALNCGLLKIEVSGRQTYSSSKDGSKDSINC